VAAHVIGWSILFEVIGPHIMPTVGDPWDAVSYACGGTAAFFCWRSFYRRGQEATADFDRLAPYYGWMERLLAGRKLQRCRAAFLQAIPPPRHALVAGQGHGAFVAELLRTHPQARCTCVDSSAGMLQAARACLRQNGLEEARAQFIRADLLEWPAPEAEFDLIVTHFFLDCFRPEQLERLMPKLSAAAAPKACWLLADFRQPASGPARWRARAILELMYVFFRWAAALPASQLTPPDPLLARHGFILGQRRFFDWGLLHSDLWIRCANEPPGMAPQERRPTESRMVGRRSSGASSGEGSAGASPYQAGASPCQNSPRIGTPTGAHEILFKCLTQSPCCGVLSRL
jgi:ubiquinone/menaquinone biosynthesis C-methylase UbiE